jgi:hypothetical protein
LKGNFLSCRHRKEEGATSKPVARRRPKIGSFECRIVGSGSINILALRGNSVVLLENGHGGRGGTYGAARLT